MTQYIHLLGIHPLEICPYVSKRHAKNVHRRAPHNYPSTKQPKSPATTGKKYKLLHIHTMRYYTEMKTNRLQLHTATRRKPPNITSREGATYKKKKKTYHVFRKKKANIEWQES